MKPCPFCSKEIHKKATTCKHCRSELYEKEPEGDSKTLTAKLLLLVIALAIAIPIAAVVSAITGGDRAPEFKPDNLNTITERTLNYNQAYEVSKGWWISQSKSDMKLFDGIMRSGDKSAQSSIIAQGRVRIIGKPVTAYIVDLADVSDDDLVQVRLEGSTIPVWIHKKALQGY